MLTKIIPARAFVLCALTFLLCHCTKEVNSHLPVPMHTQKVSSPYTLPTATYLALAKEQEGAEKQSLLLLAAGRMISEGQWRQGAHILAQTGTLTETQEYEKKLLLARIDVGHDKPKDALAKLAGIRGAEGLSTYQRIQFHELLAQSYRTTGNYLESVQERIKLEPLLADNESQTQNRKKLWRTLMNIPQADLHAMAAEAKSDSLLHGWIALALISRTYRDNPKSLIAALDQWQTQFSSHPAHQLLPYPLDSIVHKIQPAPKNIALLLPLSGPLSGPGNAVRDGFLAAQKAHKNENPQQVTSYDTNTGDVAALYQQAVQEGADYVVGPLTKSQVATVAQLSHPVPTLLLNDADALTQDNVYSFGLSPIHEAHEVANKARNKGYSRALIIAPNNDWGAEVSKAFQTQWRHKGGQVVDTLLYGAKDDMNAKMRDFLQITQSQKREKQLKQDLGYNLHSSTSRRQDFDMIFLLAYPSKARQIMPLLKYYYAGDVPVYATSSVYSGTANAQKDKDLDGVVFCDIPWVFSHQMGAKNWPEQFNSYNRLYALGADSFALATQLNQLVLFPADGAMDETGVLYLKPSQQVARVLEWGQFRQGLAHSLGSVA